MGPGEQQQENNKEAGSWAGRRRRGGSGSGMGKTEEVGVGKIEEECNTRFQNTYLVMYSDSRSYFFNFLPILVLFYEYLCDRFA